MERLSSYLDYNATARVRPEVAMAVASALESFGNPSSVHDAGRQAKARIETAREHVAELVGTQPRAVVFTSGGTEANNIALCGTAAQGRRLVVSAIEHDSILKILQKFPDRGALVPVNRDGVVDVGALVDLLAQSTEPVLISVMLANNETGVIQPIAEVVEAARDHGALVHCDSVQGPGKIPVNFDDMGVDLMSLSAHKFGGPQGVGALVVREGAEPRNLLHGGKQERGHRPGTENVPGIAGFGAAAELALSNEHEAMRIEALRNRMEKEIPALSAEAHVVGSKVPRLPNTSCIVMPGVPAETQVMSLDLSGVAVSAGSACSSGKVSRSHVLEAMGLPPEHTGFCHSRQSGLGLRGGRRGSISEGVERTLPAPGRQGRRSVGRLTQNTPARKVAR